MPKRNEAHIVLTDNGHERSVDCWCEPNRINWMKNAHGIDVLVVEHNDDTLEHRLSVLSRRYQEYNLDPLNLTCNPGAPWVSRILDSLEAPPALPPTTLNEGTD